MNEGKKESFDNNTEAESDFLPETLDNMHHRYVPVEELKLMSELGRKSSQEIESRQEDYFGPVEEVKYPDYKTKLEPKFNVLSLALRKIV
jgi:hypothetical protein